MNTVAARSASRAVPPGLTGLLVATLSIATPAVVHAGVDGVAGAPPGRSRPAPSSWLPMNSLWLLLSRTKMYSGSQMPTRRMSAPR